ncbi:cupredoxin domain-containing protein [Nitrobacter sp. NHB1]|uniref:cupredoxin domain-containing protein n=1 Tax=Nitrobacter sp. NHB1 TaxID=3119830 RepID=UPI002FFE1084
MSFARAFLLVATSAALGLATSLPIAHAQQTASLTVTYSNGKFQPSTLHAPANTPLALTVKNLDAKSMEFESASLRVETVINAKSEGVIKLRPLQPGKYEFYDDFGGKADGTLTVQ